MAIRGIAANLGEVAANTFSRDQHKDLKADYITHANRIERSELFNTLFSEAEERNEFHAAGVKIEIAEQIFRMMEKRNMTQADLARKLGKNRAYVSKILKGNTNFTIETLVLIARSLEAEWNFQLADIEKPETKVYRMEFGSIKPPTGDLIASSNYYDEIGWGKAIKWGQ